MSEFVIDYWILAFFTSIPCLFGMNLTRLLVNPNISCIRGVLISIGDTLMLVAGFLILINIWSAICS